MPARTKARKRALEVLFEADVRGVPVLDLLSERLVDRETGPGARPPISAYAADLVRGVMTRLDEIDSLIAEHAEGWTLDRMPAVDRNLLRIGVYELIWLDDVPDGVAISEAVLLAQELSTEESGPFINGILARLAAEKAAPA
jgi:transcription antitermination protein NusB